MRNTCVPTHMYHTGRTGAGIVQPPHNDLGMMRTRRSTIIIICTVHGNRCSSETRRPAAGWRCLFDFAQACGLVRFYRNYANDEYTPLDTLGVNCKERVKYEDDGCTVPEPVSQTE